MNRDEHRAALLAERAGLEPYIEKRPSVGRRLAEIDAQIALLDGPAARAAAHAADEATPPAANDTADHTPTDQAVTPRRGGRTRKET
jgi:hypothetical protein